MTQIAYVGQDQPAASSADRLSFTLFLAIAVHALLILGITFTLPEPATTSHTMEITLATHTSAKAPTDADFLAQHHQQGSGTEESARQITTNQVADFASTEIHEIAPTPQISAVSPQLIQPLNVLTSSDNAIYQVDHDVLKEHQPEQIERQGEDRDIPLLSQEIASLQAALDRQRQEYAKRPRIRTLTSVSTTASHDAQYLYEWSTRIEQNGNKHFPPEALARKITGSLRMSVVLNPDGTLYSLEILQSSGHKILDDAARHIVRLTAPFAPFPSEVRQNTDRLNIIRTWKFDIDGLNTQAP